MNILTSLQANTVCVTEEERECVCVTQYGTLAPVAAWVTHSTPPDSDLKAKQPISTQAPRTFTKESYTSHSLGKQAILPLLQGLRE